MGAAVERGGSGGSRDSGACVSCVPDEIDTRYTHSDTTSYCIDNLPFLFFLFHEVCRLLLVVQNHESARQMSATAQAPEAAANLPFPLHLPENPTIEQLDEVSMALLGFTCTEFIYGRKPKEPPSVPPEELHNPMPLAHWTSEKGVRHFQDLVISHGHPERASWSLFPEQDPVLMRARGNRAAFHKHMLRKVEGGKFTFKPTSNGWTIGERAAASGLEYRQFFEPGIHQQKTFGAVRFSHGARADADGHDDFIHGGAIQTLLDEATAECAMAKVCVLPTTVEATHKILKKVVPDKTYLFECEVVDEMLKGVKYKIVGKLLDPESNATLATCHAVIANIGAIPEARKSRYGE